MSNRVLLLIVGLSLLAATLSSAADKENTPRAKRLTDLMRPEEFKRCGLNKLDDAELTALNEWVAQTFAALAAATAKADGEVSIYDRRGNAVAYVVPADEMTIYLW